MRRRMLSALAAGLAVAVRGSGVYADGRGQAPAGLTSAQHAVLHGIASDTWRFYRTDVDPNTHLPLDNIGPNGKRGTYTSAANIGVYLWAVVAAHDLGLINRREATSDIAATLTEGGTLARDNGVLHPWYDPTTGHVIRNPGDVDCAAEPAPLFDNCFFISNVDNGWYASGLVVARSSLPELRPLGHRLMDPVNFGLFYDR